MNWKEYEDAVYEALSTAYPTATIRRDVKLPGKQSQTKRQIDILVEYYLLGKRVHIIVDAKRYTHRLDVKDVDSFIGMVQDVDAVEGILVTDKGYSHAAVERAHNASVPITLETYSLAELKEYQGPEAVVHAGIRGVRFPAPFGWVVDANGFGDSLAALYPRGKILAEATAARELMYVNIFAKTAEVQNIADLLQHQRECMGPSSPDTRLLVEQAIPRADNRPTLLRKAEFWTYAGLEYTGFVEFGAYIFFCVLITPEALQGRNVRKVQFILEQAQARDMTEDFVQAIDQMEQLLPQSMDKSETAALLFSQGKLLRQIKRYDDAKEKLAASLAAEPTGHCAYGARIQLVVAAIESGRDADQVDTCLDAWFESDPGSGTLALDLIQTLTRYGRRDAAIAFIQKKLIEHKADSVRVGFMHYQLACGYMLLNQKSKARLAFAKAETALAKSMPDKDDVVFENIARMLATLNK